MLTLARRQITKVQRIGLHTARSVVPKPVADRFEFENEPIFSYLKGSEERKALVAALKAKSACQVEIPIVIGDQEYRTKEVKYQVMPHDHKKQLARFYYATPDLIKKAIATAVEAQSTWEKVPLLDRIKIWQTAADLMAKKYRMELNSATILGQSKTPMQAEIDSGTELVDFFRYNAFHATQLLEYQPISKNPSITLNSSRYRGLEGFVAAITPFNFTAIGGNLAFTPALMGNAVLWKPSDTAVLSNYKIFEILLEAGLPPGVVNFVPADGPVFGDTITDSPHLSALNFTGSAGTFNQLWSLVGQKIKNYKNYPRLIGECGGKNYHFIHQSAHVPTVVNATIQSAFEYSGQKCSACSRMYVPSSLWPEIKEGLLNERAKIEMGDPSNFKNFVGAVIDERAFIRLHHAIQRACNTDGLSVLGGGNCDKSVGYFIEPTIIESKNPCDKLMTTELFGPVLTIYVYQDRDLDATLDLVRTSTPYGLTGAVFAEDENFLKKALEELKMTAGNFYLNDKSTGAIVGQQPFGGSRHSGTNDKAGGPHYILRFTSPQSIKETFVRQEDWKYAYMRT